MLLSQADLIDLKADITVCIYDSKSSVKISTKEPVNLKYCTQSLFFADNKEEKLILKIK